MEEKSSDCVEFFRLLWAQEAFALQWAEAEQCHVHLPWAVGHLEVLGKVWFSAPYRTGSLPLQNPQAVMCKQKQLCQLLI